MPRSPARRLVVKRVRTPLLLAAAVLGSAGLARPVSALEPRFTGAATASQAGWWHRVQGPVEGDRAGDPVRPLLPALPVAPTVPAGTIVASAVGGRVDKVAGAGLDLGSGHMAVESMGTMVSSMMGALIDDASSRVSAGPLTSVAPGEASPASPVLSPAQVTSAAAPQVRPRPQFVRTGPVAGFWNDLPTHAALLIPVVLGLALLVALALGPSGRPQPVRKRTGGLSRALDRRRGGGRDAI